MLMVTALTMMQPAASMVVTYQIVIPATAVSGENAYYYNTAKAGFDVDGNGTLDADEVDCY